MVSERPKRKNRSVLSVAQTRLLKESLRQLLGPTLGQSQPQRTEKEEKAAFLRDALNSKVLDEEWFS